MNAPVAQRSDGAERFEGGRVLVDASPGLVLGGVCFDDGAVKPHVRDCHSVLGGLVKF